MALFGLGSDWKKNICPRDWCLSAIMWDKLRVLLKALDHHSNVVLRGLRGTLNVTTDASLSNSRCYFFSEIRVVT